MIATTQLAARLVRRHRDLYVGVMVMIALTMIIGGAEVSLASAFSHPQQVHMPEVSADKAPTIMVQARSVLWLMAFLAVGICGFILVSTITQVVSYRQREFAMMRLAGASRRHLGWLVFLECLIVSFVTGIPAILLGAALAPVFLRGLQAIDFFGPNLSVDVGISAGPLFTLLVTMTLLAGFAGRSALRRIPDRELAGAHDNTVSTMSWWSMTLRLIMGVGGIVAIALLNPQALGSYGMLALPFLAVIPAVALAPLLVPAGAWLVGHLVGLVAPGSGLLAAKRSSKDRLRYARLATPAIVAVGMVGGFMVANVPDEQLQAANFRAAVQSQTVAQVTGISQTDRAAQAWTEHHGKVARMGIVNRSKGTGEFESFMFADLPRLDALTSLHVVSGDATAVHGSDVAADAASHRVGDTIPMTDTRGHRFNAHVVATYTDPLYQAPILDWRQTGKFVREPGKMQTTMYLDGLDASTAQRIAASTGTHVTTYSKAQWIDQAIATRKANSYRSNVGIFGTVYLMCLISVVQMAVSGSMARHREFHVLRSLGVGLQRLLNVVGTETIIVQLAAGVLIGLSITALGTEFATTNGTSAGSAVAEVVPLSLTAFMVIAMLALIAQLTSVWAISHRSENRQ